MRSSRSASSSACRAASACDTRPRAWPTRLPASALALGGSAPISRLASASGALLALVGEAGGLELVERRRRGDGLRGRRRRPARRAAGSSAATSTGSYCLLGPDMSSTLLVGSSARRAGGGAPRRRREVYGPRGCAPGAGFGLRGGALRARGMPAGRRGDAPDRRRRWPSVQRCDRARRHGKSLHEVAHESTVARRRLAAQPGRDRPSPRGPGTSLRCGRERCSGEVVGGLGRQAQPELGATAGCRLDLDRPPWASTSPLTT